MNKCTSYYSNVVFRVVIVLYQYQILLEMMLHPRIFIQTHFLLASSNTSHSSNIEIINFPKDIFGHAQCKLL